MDDIHISTDTTATPTPAGQDPANAAPAHQSAIDHARDAARRILATITGRSKT